MDNTKPITHLSLCAGYDGIGLGLERCGLDIGFTVFVEVEAFAVKNLANKVEAGALGQGVIWPDLKTFPFGKFRGLFNILSGGFPCQPFSHAGRKGGDEDPRHLFPYIKEGIRASRPDVVFLENVDGIATAKIKGSGWADPAGTPVLLHVIRELERVGYRATAVPSSASEVGAPHQRNRWFILGVREDFVADMQREGHQGWLSGRQDSGRKGVDGHAGRCGSGPRTGWPARPGEEQFWWEPPRTMESGRFANRHGHLEWYRRHLGNPDGEPGRAHTERRLGSGEAGSAGEAVANSKDNHGRGGKRGAEAGVGADGLGRIGPSGGCEELGDAKHAGLYGTEKPGGAPAPSPNQAQGAVSAGEPERTGRPGLCGHLQNEELANPKHAERRSEEGRVCDCRNERGAGTQGDDPETLRAGSPVESEVGRDLDGSACGMGYAELCVSCDNRTDELRLLGNGVVSQTAAAAFRIGIDELLKERNHEST